VIDSRQNRAFHYAILASLALHAVLLFTFDNPDRARALRFPPPIIARLMEPEPAPAPVPSTQPMNEEQTPRTKPAAPRVSRPVPPAAPKPPAEAPAPQPPIPALPATPAQPSPAAEAPEAPVASIIETPPASAPPAVEARESLSRDQYRLQLIDEARRHKRYPPLARENNWQGDVLVAVVIGANGRPTVTLKGSSGYEVLDRQALEMFRQAARAVAVPPALRGREFALDVRAVYGLED
jgi:protein TonB